MSASSETSLGDNCYRHVRGMRDLDGELSNIVNYIKNIIISQFKVYGTSPLETPVISKW